MSPLPVPLIGDLRDTARALVGEVVSGGVSFPAPGHSRRDRSARLLPGEHFPGGFWIESMAGENPLPIREFVEGRLGLGRRVERAVLAGPPSLAAPRRGHPDDDQRRMRAVELFQAGCDPRGTPVEIYLARRGLSLPDEPERVLRYHEMMPFAGRATPAMVALVTDIITNQPQAIHRTALDHEGRKIEIDGKDRLALGPLTGGAVKLTPDEDVTLALGVGEGIESTLSLRLLPQFGASPVWALLSASGLAAFPVLAGVECLWIAVDHDEAGERAARACAERWRAAGREVFLVRPKLPKADLNDVVQRRRQHG